MKRAKHSIVEFAVNHPKLVVILSVVITIGLAIPIPFAQIDTDPENMLEHHEPVRQIHHRIKEEFALSDHLVVGFVGEKNLLTDDFVERLGTLVEAIEDMEGVVSEDVMAPSTVDDIYRTPDSILVVRGLTDERLGYEDDQQAGVAEKIRDNPILRGKLGSDDGRAVAIYIPLEEKKYAHDVALAVEEEIAAIGGLDDHHIAGLPVAEETFGKEMFK
jgi:hypothetical protein